MIRLFLSICATLLISTAANAQGIFDSQSDVGDVLHPGAADYDPATKHYIVSGSGENMWSSKDDFHFVWKKISGEELSLTATISILGEAAEGHRKAVLMIRQSLDDDSPYVDAARHGDGLISLQYREHKGETTHEVESNLSGASTLRIEKRGSHFYLWLASSNQELEFAGGSARVEMQSPFYVGIGVCAHNKDAVEKAEFSDVTLNTGALSSRAKYSTIETVLKSGDARVAYVSAHHLTNAGWSPDGHSITFDVDGRQQQIPFAPLKTSAPVGDPVADPTPVAVINCTDLCTLQVNTKTLTAFDGTKESLGPKPWSPDGRRLVFISYQ